MTQMDQVTKKKLGALHEALAGQPDMQEHLRDLEKHVRDLEKHARNQEKHARDLEKRLRKLEKAKLEKAAAQTEKAAAPSGDEMTPNSCVFRPLWHPKCSNLPPRRVSENQSKNSCHKV